MPIIWNEVIYKYPSLNIHHKCQRDICGYLQENTSLLIKNFKSLFKLNEIGLFVENFEKVHKWN
jgi:hypothetical protein